MNSTVKIKMPDIGDFDEVEIIEIAVAVGDSVGVDDVLITVESDKASMDIPCGQAGVIQKLIVALGDKVTQGSLIALLESCDTGENAKIEAMDLVEINQPSVDTTTDTLASPLTATKPIPPRAQKKDDSNRVASGPSARRLARELGLDISQVSGSGKRGRIIKGDVKNHAKSLLTQALLAQLSSSAEVQQALPDLAKFGAVHCEEMSNIEKITSINMQRNWNLIPHAWLQQHIDITELEAERQRLKSSTSGVTMTALMVKVLAQSLNQFPRFNSALDVASKQLIYRDYIHIGIAVDTPKGLVVVVIRNANKKSIIETATELARLSESARENKLSLNDMQGACMTISNLGGMGTSGLQPMVNWPEVAILGVAASTQQPVYIDDQLQPRLIMPVTLGFDHRVINGADGSRFLAYLQALLEDSLQLLVRL